MPHRTEVHTHLVSHDDGSVMLALVIPPSEEIEVSIVFHTGLTEDMVVIVHEALNALDAELRAGLKREAVN